MSVACLFYEVLQEEGQLADRPYQRQVCMGVEYTDEEHISLCLSEICYIFLFGLLSLLTVSILRLALLESLAKTSVLTVYTGIRLSNEIGRD